MIQTKPIKIVQVMIASVLVALLLGTTGCTGWIDNPSGTQVASFALVPDNLGALQISACVKRFGDTSCGKYPNPLACDKMQIVVTGDGKTRADCLGATGKVVRQMRGVAEGIPLVCHARLEQGCVRCTDIYGVAIYDDCNPDVEPFVDVENPSTEEAELVTIPLDSICHPNQARQVYARALNQVLMQEGLAFSYAPDLSGASNTTKIWKYKEKYGDICEYWEEKAQQGQKYTQCWSDDPSRCHCETDNDCTRCRCGRINVSALRSACKEIPRMCDRQVWTKALTKEYGTATQWLFNGTYKDSGQKLFSYNSEATSPPPSGKDVKCLGSPLVLDLADDGISLTSPAQGVRFDLLGTGAVSTAWVGANDDALLVLDRDGNGRIDDGTELFGEAGAPADGFSALAQLDRPMEGGNGNGLLDAGDLIFSQLQLWRDVNTDGVSQASELVDLATAGIQALSLSASRSGRVVDSHGNDLSLRSTFLRTDGRTGVVVDVLFSN